MLGGFTSAKLEQQLVKLPNALLCHYPFLIIGNHHDDSSSAPHREPGTKYREKSVLGTQPR
jgi:hypothetical protein